MLFSLSSSSSSQRKIFIHDFSMMFLGKMPHDCISSKIVLNQYEAKNWNNTISILFHDISFKTEKVLFLQCLYAFRFHKKDRRNTSSAFINSHQFGKVYNMNSQNRNNKYYVALHLVLMCDSSILFQLAMFLQTDISRDQF